MIESQKGVPNILNEDGTVNLLVAAKAPYQLLAAGTASRTRNYLYWVAVSLLCVAVIFLVR